MNAKNKLKLLIINGPNLNLLGTREPHIYGNRAFEKYFKLLDEEYPEIDLGYYQSNHEGELIDKMHEMRDKVDGYVLNAGGLSHTSVVLADCMAAMPVPVIEVHISNVFDREKFRQNLLTGKHSSGFISGFGMESYRLAVESFRDSL